MTATEFKGSISLYFDHFLRCFGFLTPAKFTISGRMYDATYEKSNKSLSISYEPGDEYLEIILFEKNGEKLSDYDDRTTTKSLSDLNRQYTINIKNTDINKIDESFNSLVAENKELMQLKKKARELNISFFEMNKLGKL